MKLALIFGAWIALNAAFVARRWWLTRDDNRQVVSDVFDGKRIAAISDCQTAKERKDTRRMNAAAERAREATVIELRSIVRGR